MSVSIAPTQSDIFTALRSFLVNILPEGMPVVQGQANRVSEPSNTDFVVMWPLRFPRLATNIDGYLDAVFTGSISGGTLTITAVDPNFTGQVAVGSSIFGVDVALNTTATGFGTGHGGVGTYTVSPEQTIASETLAAGTVALLQKAECVIQIDVHGPISGDNAQIISTSFRDLYACDFFASVNPNIAPLYADDPRQMPFLNAEQQFEDRYVIEAHMQVNQTVVVPQEFFAAVDVGLINVDEAYPPA